MANDVNPEGLDKRRFLLDLFRDRILGAAAKLRGDARLADIEGRWRDEVINYFNARAEFLSYDEIWNNDPEFIKINLGPAEGEMFIYDNFIDGQRNQEAIDLLYSSAKERLFDSLFIAEADQVSSTAKIESQNYEQESQRAWFAALSQDGDRSLGRDLFVEEISIVAHVECDHFLKRIEALEEERQNLKVEDWPLNLGQNGSAIVYGSVTALVAMQIGEGDSGIFPLLILQTIICAYFLTLYTSPKRKKPLSKVLLVAFLAYLLSPIPMLMIFSEGHTIANALLIGTFAAALGWIREPILKGRARKRIDKELATLRSSIAGSSDRIRSRDYIASLLVLTSKGISRAEALATNRQNAGYGAAYTGSAQSAVIQKAQKSRVAANHGDGVSFGALGMNYASDGTLTTEIMDGVSIDSKGGMNTRLFDGVTLHSDGKYTTEVTKGVEIRSDGQITTEVGGFRLSSGGKEKKKDEWDWGTGKKKEKGWFD